MPISKHRRKNITRRRNPSDLFKSEIVISNAKKSVQDLLQSAFTKLSYHQIVTAIRTKVPYLTVQNAHKRDKKPRLVIPYQVIWSSKQGRL